MQTQALSTDEIRYDPALQAYDALVTVYTITTTRRYACTVPAPITMTHEQAAMALRQEALRRHCQAPGLYSAPMTASPKPAPRLPMPRRWYAGKILGPLHLGRPLAA